MNKSGLVSEVCNLLNNDTSFSLVGNKWTKSDAEKIVNIALEALTNGLKQDGSVQIVGFGAFSVAVRGARSGVNPRTGEKIQVAESKNIKFKAGAKLKEIL